MQLDSQWTLDTESICFILLTQVSILFEECGIPNVDTNCCKSRAFLRERRTEDWKGDRVQLLLCDLSCVWIKISGNLLHDQKAMDNAIYIPD